MDVFCVGAMFLDQKVPWRNRERDIDKNIVVGGGKMLCFSSLTDAVILDKAIGLQTSLQRENDELQFLYAQINILNWTTLEFDFGKPNLSLLQIEN